MVRKHYFLEHFSIIANHCGLLGCIRVVLCIQLNSIQRRSLLPVMAISIQTQGLLRRRVRKLGHSFIIMDVD
jgi:hypothetical protein